MIRPFLGMRLLAAQTADVRASVPAFRAIQGAQAPLDRRSKFHRLTPPAFFPAIGSRAFQPLVLAWVFVPSLAKGGRMPRSNSQPNLNGSLLGLTLHRD